jgi:hypothetical protein
MVWPLPRHPVTFVLKIMKTKPAAEAGQVLVELDRKAKSRRN